MFVGQPPLQSGPCVFSEGDCAAMDVLAANRSNNEERSGFLRMFKVSHDSKEGKRIACSGSITVVTSPLDSSTRNGVRRGSQNLHREFDSHPRLQFPHCGLSRADVLCSVLSAIYLYRRERCIRLKFQ